MLHDVWIVLLAPLVTVLAMTLINSVWIVVVQPEVLAGHRYGSDPNPRSVGLLWYSHGLFTSALADRLTVAYYLGSFCRLVSRPGLARPIREHGKR